jgi:hypothetical protein
MDEPDKALYDAVKAKLESAIAEFKLQIGYTESIEVSDPHYRFQFVSNPRGETQFPCAEKPGCYAFFSTKPAPAGHVLYVGKGSRYMGNRMWNPFGRWRKIDEKLPLPFPNAEQWIIDHQPGFVAITVPEKHWWLAMALEGFLIEHFKNAGEPLVNKRFR